MPRHVEAEGPAKAAHQNQGFRTHRRTHCHAGCCRIGPDRVNRSGARPVDAAAWLVARGIARRTVDSQPSRWLASLLERLSDPNGRVYDCHCTVLPNDHVHGT